MYSPFAPPLIPSSDKGADLDRVYDLFAGASPELMIDLLVETYLRVELLPVGIIIAVLVHSKGFDNPEKTRANLYARIEGELRGRGRKDVEALLRGLR